ncbi:MAG: hypothetical protein H0U75_11720 [Legionella sp.]|nr:hypothetical protein [Legionella sp.]
MNKKVMNNQELKEAITQDIERLKTLEVDIMPAQEYYQTNARLVVYVFLKTYATILLGYILPCFFYWQTLSSNTPYQLLMDFLYMALLALGVCLFAMLFISSAINQYVILNYQLKNKLKTGGLIVEKIRLAGTIAYRIFAAIVLIPSIFLPPGCALILGFGAFIMSGFLTSMLIEMELNRIGISTLFTLVKNYFDKDKKATTQLPQNK